MLHRGIRNRAGIVRLGATDFDEDSAHGVSKQAIAAAFKPHDLRSVNDADYYRNGAGRAINVRKNRKAVHNLRAVARATRFRRPLRGNYRTKRRFPGAVRVRIAPRSCRRRRLAARI